MSTTTEFAAPAATSHVAVKLNTFSTSEPRAWFRRTEGRFRIARISTSTTMADYVMQALPDDVFHAITPWLDDQPDNLAYEDLKQHLLQQYSKSTTDRAQQILRLTSQPIGDQTVRQAWNEIVSLSRLNEVDPTTGKLKEIDLRREILLQRLPDTVRAALPEAEDASIDDLVEKADKLLLAGRASRFGRHQPINQADAEDLSAAAAFVGRPPRRTARQQRDLQPPSKSEPAKLSTITPSGLCGYHHKFGHGARRCATGCLWHQLQALAPKNGDAGRA